MQQNHFRKSLALPSIKGSWLSIIGWGVVFSLALYFTYTNALRYFDLSNPVYTKGEGLKAYKPFARFIAAHVAGGVIALLIGPFQFFSVLRKKYPHVHRTIGKVYLLCVLA